MLLHQDFPSHELGQGFKKLFTHYTHFKKHCAENAFVLTVPCLSCLLKSCRFSWFMATPMIDFPIIINSTSLTADLQLSAFLQDVWSMVRPSLSKRPLGIWGFGFSHSRFMTWSNLHHISLSISSLNSLCPMSTNHRWSRDTTRAFSEVFLWRFGAFIQGASADLSNQFL